MARKITALRKKKVQGANGKVVKKPKVTSKPKDAIVMARKTTAPQKKKVEGGNGKVAKKQKVASKSTNALVMAPKTTTPRKRKLQVDNGKNIQKAKVTSKSTLVMAPKSTAPRKKTPQDGKGKIIKKANVTSKQTDRKTTASRKRKLPVDNGNNVKKTKVAELPKIFNKFPKMKTNAVKWKKHYDKMSPAKICFYDDGAAIWAEWVYPRKQQNWPKQLFFMSICRSYDRIDSLCSAVCSFFEYLNVKNWKSVYINVSNCATEIFGMPLFRNIEKLVYKCEQGSINKFYNFAKQYAVEELVMESNDMVIPAEFFGSKLFRSCKKMEVRESRHYCRQEDNIHEMTDAAFLEDKLVGPILNIDSSQLSFKAIRMMVERLENEVDVDQPPRSFVLQNMDGRPFNMREIFPNGIFIAPDSLMIVGSIRVRIENWTTIILNSPIGIPQSLEKYGELPELPMERILSFLDRATLKNYAQASSYCHELVQRCGKTSPKVFKYSRSPYPPNEIKIELVYKKSRIFKVFKAERPGVTVRIMEFIEKMYNHNRDGGTKEVVIDSRKWPDYITKLKHFNHVNKLTVMYHRSINDELVEYIDKWPVTSLKLQSSDTEYYSDFCKSVPSTFFEGDRLMKISEELLIEVSCNIRDRDFLRLNPKRLLLKTATLRQPEIQQKMLMMIAEENRSDCQELRIRLPDGLDFTLPDGLHRPTTVPHGRRRTKNAILGKNYKYRFVRFTVN